MNKQKWVDNNIVKNCYKCKTEFSLYIRKHHCRICGNIFCYKCSDNFINIENKNNFFFSSSTSRVCKKCFLYYKNINNISQLIDIFLLLPITIKEYYIISQVSKKYNKLGNYLINHFKKIQYYFTDHKYNYIDKQIIWNNRKYLSGHNKWLIQLIKSNHHKDINKILTKERKIDCKYLKCSKVCNKDFKPEDSIICLYPYIDNTNVIDFILSKLSLADTNQLKTYLPYLVYLLRFNNEQNIKITDYLIYLSSINYFFCNYFFCELNTQLDNSNIYIEIRNKLLNKIQKTSKDYLNDSYNFNNNLIYIIHNSSSIDNFNLIFKNHFESKNYNLPISLGINPNILIYDIAKNSNIKNSNSKPMVLSFKTNDSKYSLLYKKEDLRTDLLVMNIISLIDEILKEEENLDLHIIKYNVLPINNEEGFIEIIPNSKTLYDIDKEGFTLQNYIIEKNKNKPIHTWRSKFTKSCAFYCVISYLLGFGDRHLENIMINDQGILFHIDFTYILGKDPKILFPEIRITQDMVDCMGGVESIYYKEFEKLCAIIYNCLRRHFNLFQVLLYMLHHYDPKIKLNYSKDYINKYIVHKFFPNEENKEARIFIINKMSKFVTRNYSDSFVDICHNYAKDSKILDKYNSVLKYLNNS